MDEFLRGLLIKKWKLGSLEFTFLDALLAICITGTGVMMRIAVKGYTVTDNQKMGAMLSDFILAFFCGGVQCVLLFRGPILFCEAHWNKRKMVGAACNCCGRS